MDQEESRKYESIDALIMAAEVLERAESMAKQQLALKDNHSLPNCCRNSCYNNQSIIKHCKHSRSCKEDNFNFQQIEDFKDIDAVTNWNERYKSDNRISFREWSYIKKKLKGFTTNGYRTSLATEPDEDTPTASEDEDHNKYNSLVVNVEMDDITDDASECEEIKTFSYKSRKRKSSSFSKNLKTKIMKDKARIDSIEPFKMQCTTLHNSSRTRKHRHSRLHSVRACPAPLCDSMTARTLDPVSVPSLLDLHRNPPHYKLPVMFQSVDI